MHNFQTKTMVIMSSLRKPQMQTLTVIGYILTFIHMTQNSSVHSIILILCTIQGLNTQIINSNSWYEKS